MPSTRSPARLTGRRGKCSDLDRIVADTVAGSRVLVLRGEAGVGKSALLEYLAGQVGGWRVISAMGVESEMELAYNGLHQLCSPVLDGLDRLPAPRRNVLETAFGLRDGGAPDRFLVGLATPTLLADASERQPLICIVDDAQWLDQASAQVLAFVGCRLQAERIAVVCAARTGVGDDALAGLPVLAITGLHDTDARSLLLENVNGATEALNQLTPKTQASGTNWALGIDARSRALLSEGKPAEDLYRHAIECLSRTRLRVESACTHLLYREWLRREGRRVEARRELTEAREMFSAMGRAGFADRGRRNCSPPGQPCANAYAKPENTSPQETQIARLARDGSSNSEIAATLFVSPRTVEWHLRKVFIKLGISRRGQLIAALPMTAAPQQAPSDAVVLHRMRGSQRSSR
jgi:DNA-binding CsgD family transcriptional regulator